MGMLKRLLYLRFLEFVKCTLPFFTLMKLKLLNFSILNYDVYMFKVKVHYKDKGTVLSSDFGLNLLAVDIISIKGEWTFLVRIQTQIKTNLIHIATLNCDGFKRSRNYINNYLHCCSCYIIN